jgi:hypothetical protein
MAKYIKPTLETKFHVDFSWWQKEGQNLKAYLRSHVCADCKQAAEPNENELFDWVSPETGEVFQLDILWHQIASHCYEDPSFFDSRVPLTSAIFRTFILNNNTPLTAVEIHKKIQQKTPDVILRTIGSRQVYKGIKPVDYSI